MNSIQLPLGMQLLGQQPGPLYSHKHLPHHVQCIVLIVSPVLTILCLQLCYEVDTKVTLLQKSKLRYREIKYTQEQVQSRNQIVINPSILSPVPSNLRFYCLFLPLMLKFQMPVCLVKNSLCPLFCILEDLRHSSVIACLSSGLNRLQFICLLQQTFWEEVIQGHQGDYQEAYLFFTLLLCHPQIQHFVLRLVASQLDNGCYTSWYLFHILEKKGNEQRAKELSCISQGDFDCLFRKQ